MLKSAPKDLVGSAIKTHQFEHPQSLYKGTRPHHLETNSHHHISSDFPYKHAS